MIDIMCFCGCTIFGRVTELGEHHFICDNCGKKYDETGARKYNPWELKT